MDEHIEVDFYVCGIYRGKRKVGKHSICGVLLSGNIHEGLNKLTTLEHELNQFPGVKAKVTTAVTGVCIEGEHED